MEPPSVSGLGRAGPRAQAGRPRRPPEAGNRVAITSRNARAGLVASALAAVLVGFLGVAGGLVWIVAGVFTVRAVWGAPPGLAWGIACLGAGARWGTMTLADVESATRIFGPTVASGPPVARVGLLVALAAAVLSEARGDGLRARSWPVRGVALAALFALLPLYCVPGPGDPTVLLSLGLWAGAGAAATAAALGLAAPASRLPGWTAPAAATAGLLVAAVVT